MRVTAARQLSYRHIIENRLVAILSCLSVLISITAFCPIASAQQAAGSPPPETSDPQAAPAGEAEGAEAPGEPSGEEESAEDEKEDHLIEEVVVTASRREESPFLSERSVDVVGKEEIREKQPRSVPETLRESPGVFVQQTNFGGGSPIIRGLVGPQVLILIDGVRLNNSVFRTGPLQYLNLLDQYQVQRLEVVRGPGSVLYGSDAMGATINAITIAPIDRRRDEGFGYNGRVVGKYGSAAREKTGHGLIDLGHSWFGSNLNATIRDFDDLEGGRGVGTQPYSSYRQANAAGKLTARLKEGFFKDWRFTIGYHLARIFDAGRAEALEAKHKYNVYQNAHDLLYTKGSMKFEPIMTDFELTLSYQHFFEEKETDYLDETHTLMQSQSSDRTTVNTIGVGGQSTTKILSDRLAFVYGGEYYHDGVDSSRRERDIATPLWHDARRSPFPEGSAYYLGGAYLFTHGELLPSEWDFSLRLSGGYRFQQMGGSADARSDAPAIDYDHNAHILTAGIQGSYKHHWMSAFTWSQGFRAPNLQESIQIGDTGDWYHVDNPNLGPERNDTFELLTRFKAWRLSASMTGYFSLLADIIKRVPASHEGRAQYLGLNVVKNANGGEGRIYGAEGELWFRLWWGFSLSGALTYTYGEEHLDEAARLEDPDHPSKLPLSKIPPLFGTGNLRWQSGDIDDVKVFAETYLQFAARQDRLSEIDKDDVRIPDGGTPGWVTWNARSGVDLYDHLRLGLTLENLTNTRYKYHASGVYGAGTNAVLSVEGRY